MLLYVHTSRVILRAVPCGDPSVSPYAAAEKYS